MAGASSPVSAITRTSEMTIHRDSVSMIGVTATISLMNCRVEVATLACDDECPLVITRIAMSAT